MGEQFEKDLNENALGNSEEIVKNETNIQNDETKEKKTVKNVLGQTLFLIVVVLLLGGLGFMVFKRLTTKKEVVFDSVPSVNVTHIRKGTIEKEISVMGNVLPTDTYYVVAKVAGDILKVHVENGDEVKKGDPICEIDASKEIEAAYIQYDTAMKSYERMLKLYQAGDISLQNFESVKAQYESYKLQYDTKVEYSIPVAVADGVVENTNMTENTAISQGTVLCYITSEGAKEINFGVTERILAGIKLNDEVKIEKSGEIYDGYISNISNLIDAQTGLFKVKAVITTPNNFASGIMAKVTFPYIRKTNVNILPNELIYYENSLAYLYVVGDDNVVTKKYIEVGMENENISEILTDIDRNLKIVSTWSNDLAEGTLINIVKDEKVEDEVYIESVAKERIKEIENKKIEEETIEKATKSVIDKNELDVDETKKIETSEIETSIIDFNKVETDVEEIETIIGKINDEKATLSLIVVEEETSATQTFKGNPFFEKEIDENSAKIMEVE